MSSLNLLMAAPALMVVLVSLEVLTAMRLGHTCWVLYPAWLGIAVTAFAAAFVDPMPWPVVGLAWGAAGMLWRMRQRLVCEVTNSAAE